MKLVIDMSALSVDKRKMVVDYLQDNDVPLTWAGDVNPQLDIYAEVAKELNSLPMASLKNWGTPDRFVGADPAMGASYTPPLFEHGTKEPKPNPFLIQRAMREAHGLELMTEEDFRAQYMCEFKPDPKAWIPHYGGPCPVNHDEVEVELRGDHRPGKDVETRSVKRRGMPESFIWQWGRPTDPTSRNDVLNWRLARPKENTQEWADAEARRQQGLEPKPVSHTTTKRLCPFCGSMPEYTHRDGLPVCKCTTKGCAGNDRWLEYEEFEELNVTLNTPALRREVHYHKHPNEVAQCCYGTQRKHRWAPTRPLLSYKSPSGKEVPILECVHCYVRIYGPYEELPLHLRNEDDPSVNMHHQD